MGYFINGKTNQLFRIKKQNLVPAFHELCKMNVNNSLKGGSGSPFDFEAPTAQQKAQLKSELKQSYATTPDRSFGWVDWNFDETCHNLQEALTQFGFSNFEFNKNGDLTSMSFDTKNGDVNFALDAIAPFVAKGGKMHWHGEDGEQRTTNFNAMHVLTPRQLVLRRNKLVKRLAKVVKTYSKLSYKQLNKLIVKLALDIAHFAVECGGSLAKQSVSVDLASLPSELMNTLMYDTVWHKPMHTDDHLYPNQDLPITTGNSALHLSNFPYKGMALRHNKNKPLVMSDLVDTVTNRKLIVDTVRRLSNLDLKSQIKTMLSIVIITLQTQKYSA